MEKSFSFENHFYFHVKNAWDEDNFRACLHEIEFEQFMVYCISNEGILRHRVFAHGIEWIGIHGQMSPTKISKEVRGT